MNLANIVAAIVKLPADFIDEVKVSMADIDRQRAERSTPSNLTKDEQEMIDAMRRNTKR